MTDRIRSMLARRRWPVATAAVATLTAIGSLIVQPFAAAAPPPVKPLPSVGDETALSVVASDVPIRVGGSTVTASFTGTLKTRAQAHPVDLFGNSVGLRVVSFEMQADTPELGKVALARKSVDTAPLSSVGLARYYPMTLKNSLFLDFTVAVDRLPGEASPAGGGAQQAVPAGAIVLEMREPATLTNNNLRQFPPQGDVYQLQKPIELVLPANPGTTIATIEKFPLKVEGVVPEPQPGAPGKNAPVTAEEPPTSVVLG